MKSRPMVLFRRFGKLIIRRRLWFLIPFLFLLALGMLIVVILESPALIPFFYALF